VSDWTFPLGWLLAGASIGVVVFLTGRQLWRGHGRRSASLDGVKIEMHGVHPVEDLVMENLWRVTISLTNRSRRPRPLPTLASRSTIAAGKKRYLASVVLERDITELSPDDVAIAWVEATLPAGATPRSLALVELRLHGAPRHVSLRILPRSTAAGLAPVTVMGRFRVATSEDRVPDIRADC
jgi:hypothetical protein